MPLIPIPDQYQLRWFHLLKDCGGDPRCGEFEYAIQAVLHHGLLSRAYINERLHEYGLVLDGDSGNQIIEKEI